MSAMEGQTPLVEQSEDEDYPSPGKETGNEETHDKEGQKNIVRHWDLQSNKIGHLR